jgi:polysaccharide deacetylase family protein (PEP-CTERM system associated)
VIRNALSIDVEGFLESNLESFPPGTPPSDPRREAEEIRANVEETLALLDRYGVRATFFFLGTVAEHSPDVVSMVAGLGHEVASHGYVHRRLFGSDRLEFARNIKTSKERLEDLAGSDVAGFRAPEFSITPKTLWALDVLREAGFGYDSSIYPIGFHDVYGMRDAPTSPYRLSNGLVEFPLATARMFGARIPVGGGGYFRLYPVSMTRALLRRINSRGDPAMFYLHPYEIGSTVPHVGGLSPYRRFRHYYNLGRGERRLGRLLESFAFAPAIEVLSDLPLSAV